MKYIIRLKDTKNKIVYRVGDLGEGTRFFAEDLDYYDYSDTMLDKSKAKRYLLTFEEFKVFDPMKEWDILAVNSWHDIRLTEEFANKKGLLDIDYLEDIDYEDPEVLHEVITDTYMLAHWGKTHGYDITILRDIPQDDGRKFTEYAVHNMKAIK